MPGLDGATEAAVEQAWAEAQDRAAGRLFNGRVFSADSISATLVAGHWTEYRRIVAQIAQPDLAPRIGARPLAAAGVILGEGFLLVGRRPHDATYQAGQWQMPPAGSIDPRAEAAPGRVDPVRAFHAELEEEIGLTASDLSAPRPLCLVEHPGRRVLDRGFLARTKLSGRVVRARHAAARDREYTPLLALPLTDLAAFLERERDALTGQLPIFLRAAGISTPPH